MKLMLFFAWWFIKRSTCFFLLFDTISILGKITWSFIEIEPRFSYTAVWFESWTNCLIRSFLNQISFSVPHFWKSYSNFRKKKHFLGKQRQARNSFKDIRVTYSLKIELHSHIFIAHKSQENFKKHQALSPIKFVVLFWK